MKIYLASSQIFLSKVSNIFRCSGERHLGYTRQDLLGVSFYHMLHPDSMRELQSKHRLGRSL